MSMNSVKVQEKIEKYLSYCISSQLFGIKIDQVQEVLSLQKPAQLPKLPDFVEGVINYQDKVIPLIDLRKRFGLKKLVNTEFTRVMVVKVKDELIGMVADNIQRIININEKSLKKPTKMFRGLDEDYIIGVVSLGGETIVVLDLAKILSDEEQLNLFGTTVYKQQKTQSKSAAKSQRKKKKKK
jgi:purine-binding chemotaxis protein CheW